MHFFCFLAGIAIVTLKKSTFPLLVLCKGWGQNAKAFRWKTNKAAKRSFCDKKHSHFDIHEKKMCLSSAVVVPALRTGAWFKLASEPSWNHLECAGSRFLSINSCILAVGPLRHRWCPAKVFVRAPRACAQPTAIFNFPCSCPSQTQIS